MKKYPLKTITIILVLTLFLLGLFPGVAFGKSTDLKISVQPNSVKQGQTFTIKVTFTSQGERMDSLDASLSYDGDRMEYTSGGSNTVQLGHGQGTIIDYGISSNTQTYTFQFRAKKPGKATFSVDHSEIIGQDTGQLLGNPSGSIQLTIQASSDPGDQEDPEDPEDSEDIPDPKDDPIEVDRDGRLIYILRDYPSSELPEGFEPFSLTFKGDEVLGAQNPNSGMILLYGIDESFQYAFYIYDYTENLVPYVTLTIPGDQEYTFLPMDISPEGYQPDEILINGSLVSVLRPEDFKGIYLVKAMNRDGEVGYYFYDEEEGTIQRAIVRDNVVEPEEESSSFNWIILPLAGITLILLILVIRLYSTYKGRGKKS